jgi:predicted heme/steroid binding protein
MEDRLVTTAELAHNNGERGRRKYVAYRGVVYDVTDCPKWRTEMHENLHWPGQDLTSELPEAPHDEAVFERPCVRRIGELDPY